MRLALLAAVVVAVLAAPAGHAAAQQPAGAPSPRAAEVKAEVQRILSSPDYEKPKSGTSLLEKIGKPISDAFKSIGRAISRWFRRPQLGEVHIPPVLPYVLAAICLALLIIGLSWAVVAIVRMAGSRGTSANKTKPAVADEPDDEAAADVPVDTWLDTARRHAAAGEFRRAYRAVFLAVLLRLDEAGAIRYERSRTNGEYLRALRGRPALFEAMRPTARDFDQHWYGRVSVTSEDYDRMTASYHEVVDRLAQA